MITWLALALFVVGFAVLFGVRSIIQVRRTGDAGWRMLGGDFGSGQWWTRILMGIGAMAVGLAAPIADLAGLGRIVPLDQTWLRLAGLVLTLAAAAAGFAAQQAMGASWRIGVDETERTSLVTGGPFTLVRNPIFTAMMAFCCRAVAGGPQRHRPARPSRW